jgi:hypothetical protein
MSDHFPQDLRPGRKSVVLLTRLLDELVEQRGRLIHELSCQKSTGKDSVDSKIQTKIQRLNIYCDRLEEAIHLENSFHSDRD